jgi:hypothetical protein
VDVSKTFVGCREVTQMGCNLGRTLVPEWAQYVTLFGRSNIPTKTSKTKSLGGQRVNSLKLFVKLSVPLFMLLLVPDLIYNLLSARFHNFLVLQQRLTETS